MSRLLVWLVMMSAPIAAASAQTLFDRAVRELNSSDYSSAEKDFLQVLSDSPRHAGALQNLGLVYSRTGRFDRAIDCYRKAVDLRPGDPGLLLDLAIAYLKRESFADALPVFQRLMDSRPDVAAARDTSVLHLLVAGYLKQNPTVEGRRAVGTLLNSVPPAPASAVLCQLYFEGGRYDDAEQQCSKTLAADSRFPGAHRRLGMVMQSLHSPEAEMELAAAIADDSSDAQAVYYYGVALMQDGKVAEASAQLERALQLDGGFWGSYFYLGKIKLQVNDAAQALPLLRKSAALNPNGAVVFYELGRALIATGQTAEAGRAMDRVRELRAAELQRDAQALAGK
jgi:tetratricopeptide (TPR) repeat protein